MKQTLISPKDIEYITKLATGYLKVNKQLGEICSRLGSSTDEEEIDRLHEEYDIMLDHVLGNAESLAEDMLDFVTKVKECLPKE